MAIAEDVTQTAFILILVSAPVPWGCRFFRLEMHV
jgi:hypothetical protein